MEEDDYDYFTPPSPTRSAVQRRAEASPRPPIPSPNPRKRPSDGSQSKRSQKLTKTCKGEQPLDHNVPDTIPTFKKPALDMARSFYRPDATAASSANTSFTTTCSSQRSSQQIQAESAATSFMTDGGNDEHVNWRARKSSTSLEPLGGLSEAEWATVELEKQREYDRTFSQERTRESTSTYGLIDEDSLWNATHRAESGTSLASAKLSVSPATSTMNPMQQRGIQLCPQGFAKNDAPPDTVQEESPNKSQVRESHNIRDIPLQNLFIDELPDTSRNIPYFVRFLSQHLATTQSVDQEKLLQTLQSPATCERSDSFWAAVGKPIESDRSHSSKMGSKLWQAAKRDLEGYTFKGQISFSPKRSGRVFCFKPAPIQRDHSCRLQRKFGADRFLYLTAPILEYKQTDGRINQAEMDLVAKRWFEWLGKVHTFLGRHWQAFQIEPVKNSKTKNRKHDATHDKRIVLFAIAGRDIEPISVGSMLNWFNPFALNAHQPYPKVFSRVDLGLSRTVPTLVFRPSQVKYVPDMLSNGETECTEFNDSRLTWGIVPERQVMNDGCSLMSVAAAQQIWKLYREATGMRGAQALPSAFQGRIGGAKGMWIVSGESFSKDPKDLEVWIEINESQLKFQPHREDLLDTSFDRLRLTFEVSNYSTAPCASELHISFIPILVDRGVSRKTIADMMTTRLDADRTELLDSLTDSTRLYEWIHRNGAKTSSGEISWHAALPVVLEEKIKLMLEAGFLPAKSPYLADAVERFVQNKQVTKESKLRTPLAKSTFLFGVADPLGVLKPGEVHVQFSSRFTDELTEESFLHLKHMNVLVARQPACRRSDIQKVRTIVHPDLEHLIDVVVFPTRGQYPLAGKLQGGDYDGDLFWLCWDSRVVDPFYNAPAPVQSLNPLSYGIKVDKRRLSEVMNPDDLGSADNFLREAFRFRSNPSLLGLVTVLLEKKAYRDNEVYSTKLDQLCDLHDLLVDAPKQGYTFTQTDFNAFQKETLQLQKPLKKPAHKEAMDDCLKTIDVEEVEKLRQKPYRHRSDRVLDYLYFDVFRAHNTDTARRVKMAFTSAACQPDETLLFPFKHLEGRKDRAIDIELRKLSDQLATLYHHWSSGFHNKASTPEAKNAHSEGCYNTYLAIAPFSPTSPSITPWLEPTCGPSTLSWATIKASALYTKYTHPKKAHFVFKMAGQELTELKARSFPRTRMVIASIYANMKPKRIKAPAELDEEEGWESEEEFESALEESSM